MPNLAMQISPWKRFWEGDREGNGGWGEDLKNGAYH